MTPLRGAAALVLAAVSSLACIATLDFETQPGSAGAGGGGAGGDETGMGTADGSSPDDGGQADGAGGTGGVSPDGSVDRATDAPVDRPPDVPLGTGGGGAGGVGGRGGTGGGGTGGGGTGGGGTGGGGAGGSGPKHCAGNGDCPAATGTVCDVASATCVQCTTATQCAGVAGMTKCNTTLHRCVQCTGGDCGANQICSGNRCVTTCSSSGQGNADSKCTGGDGTHCNTNNSTCSPCDNNGAGCTVCPQLGGNCVTCNTDANCSTTPGTPHCDPVLFRCVQCAVAPDCTSVAAPICNPTTHTCVAG